MRILYARPKEIGRSGTRSPFDSRDHQALNHYRLKTTFSTIFEWMIGNQG